MLSKIKPIVSIIGGLVLALLLVLPVQAQGPIGYGENQVASISATAPVGFHPFSGNNGDTITAQASGITPGFLPTLTLLSPTQEILSVNNGDPYGIGDGSDARLSYRLQETGTFYLMVGSANGAPGDYLLRLRGTPASQAAPISPNTPATSTSVAGPILYAIAANPTALTTINVSTDTPDFQFGVTLRDTSGQTVALAAGGSNQPAYLTILPGNGTYEIVIVPVPPGAQGNIIVSVGLSEAVGQSTSTEPDASTSSVTTLESTCFVSGVNNITLRLGPGNTFGELGVLAAGQTVPAIARDITGIWYAVSADGQTGWAFGGVITLSGECGTLPISEGSDIPQSSSTDSTSSIEGIPTTTTSTSQVIITTATTTSQNSGSTGNTLATATYTNTPPSNNQQVVQATPTYTPTINTNQNGLATATQVIQGPPTATYTPSYTPTQVQQQAPPPTATYTYTPTYTVQPPTATYTPSYTPTPPPAAQVAPEDARFNNPLNIALDNTASVLDFVSFPGGDTEDRVRWDITGMNQTASLSGGRARLVIQATCFGEGTEHIQFFTGGQTYACGQTIVDQEVTFNSKTGSVIITAIGGEDTYVQWVLTGTATRVN